MVEEIGVGDPAANNVGLANRFRAGLGLPPGGDGHRVDDRRGCPGASWSEPGFALPAEPGAVRASFHLYSTEADVDAALDALVG